MKLFLLSVKLHTKTFTPFNAINIANLLVDDTTEDSCETFVYSRTLSTDVIWFSNSAVCRMPNWTNPASPQVCEIARPTFPPNVAENDF